MAGIKPVVTIEVEGVEAYREKVKVLNEQLEAVEKTVNELAELELNVKVN